VKIILSLAKSGSPDRWDALPYISFDNAKEGKRLTAKGKKGKKKGRKKKADGLLDTPLKGAETVISNVPDRVRFS
jgi:hypothetical protein